jgi:hypothetical protein
VTGPELMVAGMVAGLVIGLTGRALALLVNLAR